MTKLIKSRNLSILIIIGLFLVLIAGGSWFFFKYRVERSDLGKKYVEAVQQLEKFKQDPAAAATAQKQQIMDRVGRLYSLPKDDTPVLSTVQDKNAKDVKDNQFFVNAENGDAVLVYIKTKLAILYRPSTDKIVNVSSVTIQDKESKTAPATTSTPATTP